MLYGWNQRSRDWFNCMFLAFWIGLNWSKLVWKSESWICWVTQFVHCPIGKSTRRNLGPLRVTGVEKIPGVSTSWSRLRLRLTLGVYSRVCFVGDLAHFNGTSTRYNEELITEIYMLNMLSATLTFAQTHDCDITEQWGYSIYLSIDMGPKHANGQFHMVWIWMDKCLDNTSIYGGFPSDTFDGDPSLMVHQRTSTWPLPGGPTSVGMIHVIIL